MPLVICIVMRVLIDGILVLVVVGDSRVVAGVGVGCGSGVGVDGGVGGGCGVVDLVVGCRLCFV